MFSNANEFSMHIEKLAIEREITFIEAILEFCEEHSIEPDDVSNMINQSLRNKLELNFQDLNYLPKTARL
jgi:replication initiation and membrane attachment protein DnaB